MVKSRSVPQWLAIQSLYLAAIVQGSFYTKDENVYYFHSRPDLNAPKLTVNYQESDRIADGYIFLAAWSTNTLDLGPYIYDKDGELIWSGNSISAGGQVHNFHVCRHGGEDALCWFEGYGEMGGWARGHGKVFNNRYEPINHIQSDGGLGFTDMHEMHLFDTTAAVTSLGPVAYDFTKLNTALDFGWLLDSRFQEIDVETQEVLFEWRGIDHLDPADCVSPPRRGQDRNHPWDYAHLNSVDKFANGDYLVSIRHFNMIARISHETGEILWRLGGKHTDFDHWEFRMGYQHHARIRSENETTTVISFFDNGWNLHDAKVFKSSFGALISIDHPAQKAHLLRMYRPQHTTVVGSQGSLDIIPDSTNVFVCWGANHDLTEHLEGGRLIWNATLANGAAATYRAFKQPWVGNPQDKPAIWAFARRREEQMTIYASWNGATDVAFWTFWGGSETQFASLGTVSRTGFETAFNSSSYFPYVFAEALDSNGRSLANSTNFSTFVPSEELAPQCSLTYCASKEPTHADDNADKGNANDTDRRPGKIGDGTNTTSTPQSTGTLQKNMTALTGAGDNYEEEYTSEDIQTLVKAILWLIPIEVVFVVLAFLLGFYWRRIHWPCWTKRTEYKKLPTDETTPFHRYHDSEDSIGKASTS